MRSPKFVIALAGSAALVAAPLAGASAASVGGPGSNTGTPAANGPTHEAGTTTVSKKFTVYDEPSSKYTSKSCSLDLSKFKELKVVTKIKDCGTTVTLSSGFEKRTVPQSWGSWGSPPDTEDDEPHLLFSVGQTEVTITYDETVTTGGFEIEPTPFEAHSFTVDFHKGKDGDGKVVGSITRKDVDGNAGAKLFGAKADKGFKSVVITSNDGVDFAIAQVRA